MSVSSFSSSHCGLLSVSMFVLIIVSANCVYTALKTFLSYEDGQLCPPSSCGKIGNITYPFRLKSDPQGCGLERYGFELECVNNLTVLSLFSGKYHVQEINYNRYMIRLTDAGVVEDTACSFPRHHLREENFDSTFSVPITEENFSITSRGSLTVQGYPYYSTSVVFLNCSDPVTDDPRYVQVNTSDRDCDSGGHIYTVLDRRQKATPALTLMDIKVGCSVKVATLATMMLSRNDFDANWTHERNVLSYAYIRRLVEDGFWLSWLSVICEKECEAIEGKFCSVNQTTLQMECKYPRYCNIWTHQEYNSYWNHDTDNCVRPIPRSLGNTLSYIKEVIKEFVKRIRNIKRPLSYSSYYKEDLIGQDILPIFFIARYFFGVTLLFGLLVHMWRRRHFSIYENIEIFLLDINLNPIRYKYAEIKKMTRGFKVKLGQGGFGIVYKGKLRSGTNVAIKMLNKSNDNGQEFVNEVSTIGRIHHVNVVGLIGYCVDGKKRALIYKYMSNGSLDKYIFSKEGCVPFSYKKTYEISLGIARGIEYLHQGCDVQILHFDIKPHNILLDDNFIPKVSDFGLAKLYSVKDRSIVLTSVRGTLGYIAPELFYTNIGGVSYKADVYSFGMLLMEMTSRRRNSDPYAEHSSQNYFPFWIYDQFKEGKNMEMGPMSEVEQILIKKMFIVALWCIQLKPNDRPSMKSVVELLEGEIESLQMPPKPSFYPHQTIGQDVGINSVQTSWSTDPNSSSENLGKITSNHSIESKA